MFAIVRTGGKQYRVAAGDKIAVEKIEGEAGDTVSLGDILLAGDGGEVKSADGLVVSAEIIAQTRGEKVIVFKKRRRHNYRRRNGHRQSLTLLRIVDTPDRPGEDRQNVAFVHFCRAGDRVGEPDDESTEQRWFPLAALPPRQEVAFDHYDDLMLYCAWRAQPTPLPLD